MTKRQEKVYYKDAVKEYNEYYYPDNKIELVKNLEQKNYPREIIENNAMSSDYAYMKIDREELEKINKLKTRITNPATDFLLLLSYAVCRNVDTYKKCRFLTNANCYITVTELFRIFHTHSISEVQDKLNNLKYGYHAINYEVKTVRGGVRRYYINFKCCNDQILTGSYNEENPDYFNIKGVAFAAKIRKGFFFVNKIWFTHIFFDSMDLCYHGIKDLYFLLRTNTLYKDHCVTQPIIREHHVVAWGSASNSIYNGDYFYNTIANIAKYTNNSPRNVKRYLVRLQNAGFIKKYALKGKGICIINSYLDKKENIKTSYKECFETINLEFKEIDRFARKNKFETTKYKYSVNNNTRLIDNFIASVPIHHPNFIFLFFEKVYNCKKV